MNTYRFLEHVGPNDDSAMGYRDPDDVQEAIRRDPLKALESRLRDENGGDHKLKPIWVEVNEKIGEAFE